MKKGINIVKYEDFRSYMAGFLFKRIEIKVFHEFFEFNVGPCSKQLLSKFMNDYCIVKKYELKKTKSNNIWYYDFIKMFTDPEIILEKINEEDIKKIQISKYIVINDYLISVSRSIIKELKYRHNGSFIIRRNSKDNLTRIFRTS